MDAHLALKLNQDRRHHIPRQQHKVTNWPAYDASLRQRGSLTIWFTEEAITAWAAEPRTTRGGHPWYVRKWSPELFCRRKRASRPSIWGMSAEARAGREGGQ